MNDTDATAMWDASRRAALHIIDPAPGTSRTFSIAKSFIINLRQMIMRLTDFS
jgi:hypothetical protein